MKPGSRNRSQKARARANAKHRHAHPPYTTRDTIQLPGGGEVTLEIGPPVASEDSERWRVLADAALDPAKSHQAARPDPKRDRERWLQALSKDGKDEKDAA